MWETLRPPAGRVVISSCMYRNEMTAKKDFNLGAPPRLLFVGYLRPEKGVLDLLDAFDEARSQRPLQLTLAGASDRNTIIGRLVTDRIAQSKFAGDIDAVGMVPFGEPLFELYRTHDVLIQPSLSEGTPRTLVEARSLGLPVIATRVGGIPSSVRDNYDGLLVPKGDPSKLATSIHRLLDDHALRKRLIDQGLKSQKRYSLEYFADQLIEETQMALVESRA